MGPEKIIKLNGGKAFIAIGEDYVRLGASESVGIIINDGGVSLQSEHINFETEPNKVFYRGLLTNSNVFMGLKPVGPQYSMDSTVVKGLVNLGTSMIAIRSAVGI